MMKVAISTSVIQGGKSGVAQYIFSIVNAFLEQKNDLDLILFVFENDQHHFDFVKNRAQIVVVPERWRPAVKNIFWHQFILPRLLKRLKVDVLHIPSYRRMVWSAPCKMVATIHDLAPFRVKKKYDFARMIYGRVIARLLARRQDAIISISQATAVDVEQFFGIPLKNQTVIHNGVDHEKFSPRETAPYLMGNRIGCGQGGKRKEPYFLYISRLEHPAKNHVRLIEAFGEFKRRTKSDWQLFLGGSDWHGAEHIYAAAKKSEFSDDIQFLGFVSDETLPELYANAGSFVYPSLFEGFGLPPIEAMASGCPVISSGAGALTEVVGDAAIMVDPLNVLEMTEGMIQVAGDTAFREDLIYRGLRRAADFDWGDCAENVFEVYSQLTEICDTHRLVGDRVEKQFVVGM